MITLFRPSLLLFTLLNILVPLGAYCENENDTHKFTLASGEAKTIPLNSSVKTITVLIEPDTSAGHSISFPKLFFHKGRVKGGKNSIYYSEFGFSFDDNECDGQVDLVLEKKSEKRVWDREYYDNAMSMLQSIELGINRVGLKEYRVKFGSNDLLVKSLTTVKYITVYMAYGKTKVHIKINKEDK